MPVRPSLHVADEPLPKRRRGGDDDSEDDWGSNYEPTEPGGDKPIAEEDLNELFNDAETPPVEASPRRGQVHQSTDADPWICQPIGDSRIPKMITSPIKPSAEAVEQHFTAGHVDYRSWCPVCVASRGREDAHPRKQEEDDDDRTGLPIVAMDYNELNEESEKPQKIIVGVDQVTGNVFAHNVVAKGLVDDWICKRIVRDLEELGRSDVILKTDGEPAIKAVQNRVQALRHGRTVPRNPPAYNPQSNGPCEKAVQDVTAQLRTLKIALEYRMKVKIHDDAPIMQWALEHAVFLLNKLNVHRSDGMTSYERLTGRKWRRPIVEMGEHVLAKMALRRRERGRAKKQKRKLAHRCVDAVWVGQIARTGEHIVVLDSGDAVRCRTIKRVPIESRWDPERALLIRATPRCPAPSSKDPEKIESRVTDDADAAKGDAKDKPQLEEPLEQVQDPVAREGHHVPRDFRITAQVLDKYGYTDGCGGCEHKACGLEDHRPHAPQCRRRLSDAMMQDERDREQITAARRRKRAQPEIAKEAEEREVNPVDVEITADEPNDESVDADAMSIPELDSDVDMNSDNDEDPLTDAKRDFDNIDDDEEDAEVEPSSKRPRVANMCKLDTMVGKTLAGIPTTHRDEMLRCFNSVNAIKSKGVVREIIEKLDNKEKFVVPRAREVRRQVRSDLTDMDAAEMYSPPRITEMAEKLGMRPGWALDLTVTDPEDGLPWDFTDQAKRKKAKDMLRRDKPMMLIMSPMCGPFSKLQEVFNYPKMDPKDVEEKIREAMVHLKFTVEMCLLQHEAGRLFLFEHPASASSWDSEIIQSLAGVNGVHKTKFDFCMLGMTTTDKHGKRVPAKKRTAVLTNSDAIATLLRGAQCRGEHWHMELIGGRAGPCQVYPEKFSRLICEGIRREQDTIRWRNEMNEVLDISKQFGKIMALQAKMEELAVPPDEDPFAPIYEGYEFIDDVHEQPLNREMAIQARRTEIEYFRKMGVYTKVKRQPWMKVISTKWIDTNKGDELRPNYRSRLVGRELNLCKKDGLFAATPPVESLRMVLSICASSQNSYNEADNFIIMSNDIKRAYFYAPVTRPMFIAIPDEDWEDGDDEMVGQLRLSLYGTRDAAVNWTRTFTDHLVKIGFKVGKASPCNFHHVERSISLTVHGDDFTSTGRERDLQWLDGQLKSRYDVKTEFLGPREEHAKQIRVLNRVITWANGGIEYEPDQRHSEIIVKAMGVEKAVSTPGSRDDAGKAGPPNVPTTTATSTRTGLTTSQLETSEEFHRIHKEAMIAKDPLKMQSISEDESSPLLNAQDASMYRALAARANYLAQDRADIQFAVKEIARRMATPRVDDWLLMKRLARYLIGAPRGVLRYWWQSSPGVVDAYVDADWAGCKTTSRSTSGGAIKHGWHCIKTWSSTQATIASSSGESELYSLTKGASQAIGLIALASDLGISLEAKLHTDASATLGIVQRQGLGKLRHINVQYLWLQERVRNGEMSVKKVAGIDNPADLMTKHLAAHDMARHAESIGLETCTNRAETAPQLARVEGALCPVVYAENKHGHAKFFDGTEGHGEDYWKDGTLAATTEVVRIHARPRRALFTPLRVKEAPPGRCLTPARVTRGTFLDTNESFTWTDTWTACSTAHQWLERPWTGSTTFLRRSERSEQ